MNIKIRSNVMRWQADYRLLVDWDIYGVVASKKQTVNQTTNLLQSSKQWILVSNAKRAVILI